MENQLIFDDERPRPIHLIKEAIPVKTLLVKCPECGWKGVVFELPDGSTECFVSIHPTDHVAPAGSFKCNYCNVSEGKETL